MKGLNFLVVAAVAVLMSGNAYGQGAGWCILPDSDTVSPDAVCIIADEPSEICEEYDPNPSFVVKSGTWYEWSEDAYEEFCEFATFEVAGKKVEMKDPRMSGCDGEALEYFQNQNGNYFGCRDQENKSPSTGRANADRALLDVCWTGGHTSIGSTWDLEDCEDACGTSTNNSCDDDTNAGPGSCQKRCQNVF